MKKLIVNVLLVVLMIMLFVPQMAFADGVKVLTEDGLEQYKENFVGVDVYCLSTGEYKLGENIESDYRFDIGTGNSADVVLDLNGYSLSASSSLKIAIEVGYHSSLIIKDSKTNGKISGYTNGIYMSAGASLTINGGTVEAPIAINGMLNGFTVTLNDGTIFGEVKVNASNTRLVANGGTINGSVTCKKIEKDASSDGTVIYGSLNRESTGSESCVVTFMNDDAQYVNKLVTSGDTITAPVAPTKEERNFIGWYEKNDDDTLKEKAFDFIKTSISQNITLYAVFNKTYTITYNPGEYGLGTVAADTKDHAVPLKLTDETFTREGFTQIGWVDGNSKEYGLGDTYTVNASVTLYPIWKDTTAPTGIIQINSNSWNSFLSDITFKAFFKDTQTVAVTAADNSGDAVVIEYLLSNSELSKTELADASFTAYSKAFSIEPDNEYVIYVKLTDTSGNEAYINTDGIVCDETVPVINGIVNGKTYCSPQTVTITEKYIAGVTVNDEPITWNENNQFTLSPAEGEQRVIVTDKAGNKAEMIAIVNDGHTYEWKNENGQYWQKCKFCDYETARDDIPNIIINGANTVCKTQDYKFSFTLPDGVTDVAYGYDFENKGGGPITPTAENGTFYGVVPAAEYQSDENSFTITVSGKTSDGFEFFARKTVAIQGEHTGGAADCTSKAKCEICGEEYGEILGHKMIHNEAKAPTTEAEGNVEYWYCKECGRCFGDKDGKIEIMLADTVISKLVKTDKDIESPQTGDSRYMIAWLVLLFVSSSGLFVATVYNKKKKHYEK